MHEGLSLLAGAYDVWLRVGTPLFRVRVLPAETPAPPAEDDLDDGSTSLRIAIRIAIRESHSKSTDDYQREMIEMLYGKLQALTGAKE